MLGPLSARRSHFPNRAANVGTAASFRARSRNFFQPAPILRRHSAATAAQAAIGALNLEAPQKKVLTDILSVVGPRLLFTASEAPRKLHVNKNKIIFDSGEGEALTIKWTKHAQPWIDEDFDGIVLNLHRTKGFGEDASFTQGFIKYALLGHALDPYNASVTAMGQRQELSEPLMQYRDWQRQALEAAKGAKQQFLMIAPRGTGGPDVLQDLFLQKIKARAGSGLYVYVAEKTLDLDRIMNSMNGLGSLQRETPRCQFVPWMQVDRTARANEKLNVVLQLARSHPTILATTSAILRENLMFADTDFLKRQGIAALNTIAYEGATADGIIALRELFAKIPYNVRAKTMLIGEGEPAFQPADRGPLWPKAFWAYVDSAGTFQHRLPTFTRGLDTLPIQMLAAAEAGEILSSASPFDAYDKRDHDAHHDAGGLGMLPDVDGHGT